MRSVLENPEPIKNLHALLQAQQAFYAEASEAISSVLGEVEEAGTAAEADWRCVASVFVFSSRVYFDESFFSSTSSSRESLGFSEWTCDELTMLCDDGTGNRATSSKLSLYAFLSCDVSGQVGFSFLSRAHRPRSRDPCRLSRRTVVLLLFVDSLSVSHAVDVFSSSSGLS